MIFVNQSILSRAESQLENDMLWLCLQQFTEKESTCIGCVQCVCVCVCSRAGTQMHLHADFLPLFAGVTPFFFACFFFLDLAAYVKHEKF